MREKKSIYNITLKNASRKNDREITADEEQLEGLGGLPKNLTSISSLLLFNTEENPYKKYVTIDPLHGAVTRTREGMGEGGGGICFAFNRGYPVKKISRQPLSHTHIPPLLIPPSSPFS